MKLAKYISWLLLLLIGLTSPCLGDETSTESPLNVEQPENNVEHLANLGTKDPQLRLGGLAWDEEPENTESLRRTNDSAPAVVKKPNKAKEADCPPCKCGIPNSSRIVGGTPVTSNKYPWMAALTYNSRFFCGGSLISDQYVLTAGHCTMGFRANLMHVHLMNYDRALKGGLKYGVAKIHRPKGFDGDTLHNDVSLLRLPERIIFSSTMKPICLPDKDENYKGKDAIVSGWGATVTQGKATTMLREVSVPIWSNKRCRSTVYGSSITKNMLCAGHLKGEKDACQGDSGGPLMVTDGKGRFVQVGIVSFGYGCAQPNEPGVYARVTKFLSWIENKTKDSCYCNSN